MGDAKHRHEEGDDAWHARSVSDEREAYVNSRRRPQPWTLCFSAQCGPRVRSNIHCGFISHGDHRRMLRIPFIAVLLLAAPVRADNAGRCPASVIASISKAYPKVTLSACKPVRDHGKDIFEVKLTRPGGERIEVDVAADGTILQVEEPIAVDALPDPVRK
ncbi:MAG TPA: hypothetical protein VLM79_38885, partial [Kofleriaceae bacterium]|nr:hypothetical protein [Kofleriaceae bacterium]